MNAPEIGIMQGRLLPKFEGRFQAFPADRWREEFSRAREAGIACIEWIYEEPHEADNPVHTDEGVGELRKLIDASGIRVRSICADYYMTRPLVSDAKGIDPHVVDHLKWLMGRAEMLGISYIVLPFVDSSSLKTPKARQDLFTMLRAVAPLAQKCGLELHLETDFPPSIIRDVMSAVDHPFVRWNYDIGNSASLGFDCREEITMLGRWLGSVHVKDRVRGGGTVPLGTGNANLPAAFEEVRKAGFDRWFIMQVARGEEGDEVAWCKSNRESITRWLSGVENA